MSFLKELFLFMKDRKKLWLFPIVLFVVFIGALLFFSQGTVVAPFIYTLF